MGSLVSIGLANAAMAALLAVLAFGASRIVGKPPVAHLLWAVVLLKLVTPPIFRVDLPVVREVASWRGTPPATRAARELAPEEEPPRPVDEPSGQPVESAVPRPARVVADPPGENLLELVRRTDGVAVGRAPPGATDGSWLETDAGTGAGLEPGGAGRIAAPTREAAIPATAMAADLSRPSPAGRRPSRPFDAMGILAAVWLSGSLVWLLLAASRIARFRRLLRRARPAPPELAREVRRVAERLDLRRTPEVTVIRARISPLVWTFARRPRLVLPGDLLASLSASQRRTLIAHELAHLRRRDHWFRCLEVVSAALYWWFPVAWWARRELREAEEECCDAWVAWTFPERARDYAATLLSTVDFLSENPAALPEGVSGMGQVSLLKRRFHMILVRRPSHRLSPAARAAIVSIGALALSWSAAVPAQDAPAAETEEAASDAPSPEAAAVDAASPPEERSSAAILPGGAAVPPRSATVGSAGQAKPSAVVGGTKATASLPQSTDENRERARIGAAARSDASSSSPAPSASGEEIEDRAIEDRMRELRDELRRLEDVFRTLQEERRAGGEESGYGAARETYRRAKSRYGRASEGYRSANPAIEGRLADEDGRRYDIRIAGDRVTASDPDTGKTLWTTALDGDMRQIRLTSRGDSLLLSTPKKTVTIDLSNGRLAVEENGVSVLPRSTTRRPEADRERRRAPQNAVPGRARRTVAPGGSGLGEPAGSGVGIDLVELANALIEAEGALELAKVERSNLERKVERGIVDRGDVRAAEVRIETAQRKVDLLRRMARSAHTRTRSEMALLRELQETADARYRSGQGTQEAVIDAKVRLARAEMAADLLEHILGSARN